MHSLEQDFSKVLRQQELLLPGERLLVAVSGGLDSMVLLQLLVGACAGWNWEIHVAHFNHKLRGAESDADESFVREACEKSGLPYHPGEGPVSEFRFSTCLSLEMAARELRHDFLAKEAARLGCSSIVLAHHAQDQLELFFLRALRGAGPAGLGGMHGKSPAWKDPKLFLIRPLLSFHRHELASYAKEHDISFREDSSNLDTGPLRNRIRQKLLPLLAAEFGPKALEQPLRSMILTRDVADYIREEGLAWIQNPTRRDFANLHPALQRECIRQQLIQAGVKPEGDLVERLWDHPGMLWNIAAKVRVRLGRDGLLEKLVEDVFSKSKTELSLAKGRGEACFEGLTLSWASGIHDGTLPKSGAGTEWLDFQKVGQRVILRHWKPGDRFQPFGMDTPAKVGHLFINAKIPASERKGLTVATTEGGEIFWVEKLRIGDRFKLDKATASRLQWCWQRQMIRTKTAPERGEVHLRRGSPDGNLPPNL